MSTSGPASVGSTRIAPGPRGHRLLGSLPDLREDPLQLFLDGARSFGDLVRYQMGPLTLHVARHPDHVKHVLQDNNHNYGRQTRGFEALAETLGQGLLTTDGEFWRRERRIMQPAFHKQRLAGFAALMADSAAAMLERWQPQIENGQPFDVTPELLRVTLRILGLSMFGIDLSNDAAAIGPAVTEVLEHAIDRTRSFIHIPDIIPTPANRRYKEAIRTLDKVVFGLIAERRAGSAGHNDLLQMLLEARDEETGEGMDDRQLRDELMGIFLAGHETTSMALSWTVYLLSKNPAVRRTLEAEVDAVLGGRAPALEDLPRLKYARMVLDESMRLYPPAWTVGRSVTEEDQIGGYRIPRGSILMVSPYVTHRDPSLWENPEGFDPERFATEDATRPRYAYFPFGGGPHLCIGNNFALMEATLVLATITARCRLNLVEGHPVEIEPLITLRPKHGIQVTAHARKRATT